MPTLLIPETEGISFGLALAIACVKHSHERLGGITDQMMKSVRGGSPSIPGYLYQDRCVVVSFDGDYFPFLCNTMGYNRMDDRWYIPVNPLLKRVRDVVRELPSAIPGGRVFIHRGGCFYKRDGHHRTTLLDWKIEGDPPFLMDI